MKFMSILKDFSFFESYIDFSSLIAWHSVHPLKSWEFFVHIRNEPIFGLFRLFKSYKFFSKRLHLSSFEKALIDTSNLSISFVLVKFVIVSWKYASWTSQCFLKNSNISFGSKFGRIFVWIVLQSLWCGLKVEVFKCVQEFYQIF